MAKNPNSNNLPKFLLELIVLLIGFLFGWLAHAWKNRRKIAQEVKKSISKLSEIYRKVTRSMKEKQDKTKRDMEKEMEWKNQTIAELKSLIQKLTEKDENGVAVIDTSASARRFCETLKEKEQQLL